MFHVFHAVVNWLTTQYWSVSWPNIFAPSIWTLFGIAVSHTHFLHRHKKAVAKQLEKIDEHGQKIETLSGHVQTLSEKIPGENGARVE